VCSLPPRRSGTVTATRGQKANHFQLAGYAVLRSSNLLLCHSPCVFVNTFQQHFVDAWGDLRSSDLRSSIFSAVLLVSRHSLTHRGCASRKRRSLSFRGPACPWDGPALSGTLSITFPFSLHALRFSFVFALLTPGMRQCLSQARPHRGGPDGRRGAASRFPNPVRRVLRSSFRCASYIYSTSPRLRITK